MSQRRVDLRDFQEQFLRSMAAATEAAFRKAPVAVTYPPRISRTAELPFGKLVFSDDQMRIFNPVGGSMDIDSAGLNINSFISDVRINGQRFIKAGSLRWARE